MAQGINIGALDFPLEGLNNLDYPEFDIRNPWPFPDKSLPVIVMSHVLEHVTRKEGEHALSEASRTIQDGGVLHIAVPDLDKFIDCHLAQDFFPLGGYTWTDLNKLMGGGEDEAAKEMRHRYMYCFASLAHMLNRAGFTEVLRVPMGEWDNPKYEPISLYVEATKCNW